MDQLTQYKSVYMVPLIPHERPMFAFNLVINWHSSNPFKWSEEGVYLFICGQRGECYCHLSIRKLLQLCRQLLQQVCIQPAHKQTDSYMKTHKRIQNSFTEDRKEKKQVWMRANCTKGIIMKSCNLTHLSKTDHAERSKLFRTAFCLKPDHTFLLILHWWT